MISSEISVFTFERFKDLPVSRKLYSTVTKQVPMTCKLGQFGMGKCRNDVTVVLFSLDSASKEPRTLGIHRVMHSFSESHYPLPFVAYLPPNNDLSSFPFFASLLVFNGTRASEFKTPICSARGRVSRQIDISIFCRKKSI